MSPGLSVWMSSRAAASACLVAWAASAGSEISIVLAASGGASGGRTPACVGVGVAPAGSAVTPAMRLSSSLTASAAMREMV